MLEMFQIKLSVQQSQKTFLVAYITISFSSQSHFFHL